MAVTKLKRKVLKRKVQARDRKNLLKRLMQKPILKNKDRTATKNPRDI